MRQFAYMFYKADCLKISDLWFLYWTINYGILIYVYEIGKVRSICCFFLFYIHMVVQVCINLNIFWRKHI